MQETRVQPLGWENPLEKEMAPHSSILAWKTLGYSPWGHKELDTTEHALTHTHTHTYTHTHTHPHPTTPLETAQQTVTLSPRDGSLGSEP